MRGIAPRHSKRRQVRYSGGVGWSGGGVRESSFFVVNDAIALASSVQRRSWINDLSSLVRTGSSGDGEGLGEVAEQEDRAVGE